MASTSLHSCSTPTSAPWHPCVPAPGTCRQRSWGGTNCPGIGLYGWEGGIIPSLSDLPCSQKPALPWSPCAHTPAHLPQPTYCSLCTWQSSCHCPGQLGRGCPCCLGLSRPRCPTPGDSVGRWTEASAVTGSPRPLMMVLLIDILIQRIRGRCHRCIGGLGWLAAGTAPISALLAAVCRCGDLWRGSSGHSCTGATGPFPGLLPRGERSSPSAGKTTDCRGPAAAQDLGLESHKS